MAISIYEQNNVSQSGMCMRGRLILYSILSLQQRILSLIVLVFCYIIDKTP